MKTIVNLTIPTIVEEIETVLNTEPYCSHPQILAIPDLREELIAYALSRVRSRYRVVDQNDKLSVVFRSLTVSSEERLTIEETVRQGICYLMQKSERPASSPVTPPEAEIYLTLSR